MGFLIMSQHPHLWRVQSRAHCPVILHLRVTNLSGPDSKLHNAVRNGPRERMIANASASSLRSNLHRAQRPRRPRPSQRRSTRLPTHSILLVPATREKHHAYPSTQQTHRLDAPAPSLSRLPRVVVGQATTHRFFCSLPRHVHGPRQFRCRVTSET